MHKKKHILRSILLILGVALSLIALTWMFHGQVYDMLAEDRGTHLLGIVEGRATAFERSLAGVLEYLDGVAAMAVHDGEQADWNAIAASLLESRYHFVQAGVVDEEGRGRVGPDPTPEGYTALRDTLSGKTGIHAVPDGAPLQAGLVLFSVPLRLDDANRYALYGVLARGQLAAMLEDIPAFVDSWSFVTDAKRGVLLPLENPDMRAILTEWTDDLGGGTHDNTPNAAPEGRTIHRFEAGGHTYFMLTVPMRTGGWVFHSLIPDDGASRQMHSVGTLFLTVFGALVGLFVLVLVYIQIAGAKHRAGVFRLAYIDSLTGMPNWEKMRLDLDGFFHGPGREGSWMLASLDVKGFKIINEMQGYERGNELLRHIAAGLAPDGELFRMSCRHENDSFVILAPGRPTELFGENLRRRLETIACDAGLNQQVRFSCGVCTIPAEGPHDWNSLMSASKIARETLKKGCDTAVAFYDNRMKSRLVEAQRLRDDMDGALRDGDFVMYLQPKFAISYPGMERLVGAEALVRWNHKTRGLLPPAAFIPVFEESGGIEKLDRYVFRQACLCVTRWTRQKRTPLSISVNLSRVELSNRNLGVELAAIADECRTPHKLIDIELTESAAFGDMDLLLEVMHSLKNHGFKLSLDDFGTGYSSLSLLRNMPMDVLKLDKSFIDPWQSEEGDPKGLQFVKDIVVMADNLGIQTISEGVETRKQVELLREAGCGIVQGYYFGRPMPVENFEQLLQSAADTRMYCQMRDREEYTREKRGRDSQRIEIDGSASLPGV